MALRADIRKEGGAHAGAAAVGAFVVVAAQGKRDIDVFR